MAETIAQRQQLWQRIIPQVEAEYLALPAAERGWIAERLPQLARLQGQLDSLFRQADGLAGCRTCRGECCARGHNHLTLANLLAYLTAGELPPTADFSRTCPFLDQQGCLLAAERRPYNCISFLCDTLEVRLRAEEVEEFYRLDRHLRTLYQAFAARYAGGGLTGLLLQGERLAGSPFLALRPEAVAA